MPTIIGVIFIGLGILCLAAKEEWLFGLVIISSLFEAASAINFGSQGIQPYYIVACLFIFSQLRRSRFWEKTFRFNGDISLFYFGCLSTISALLFPFLFRGTPVYSPKVGLDDGFFFQTPLDFDLGNIAQATYLIINIFTVKSAAVLIKTDTAKKAYNFCFWLLATIILMQFIFLQVGITFPYWILQNNPGYSSTEISGLDTAARVMGTFTEPSVAGLALTIFFAGYFYEFFVKGISRFKTLFAAMLIAIVRSSSSLVATSLTIILIFLAYPVFRSLLVISKPRLIKTVAIVATLLLVIVSPVGSALKTYTFDKEEDLSYIHRTAADLFSLKLAADTHWIGVGLGSNRPSSLLTALVSNLGIAGLILFFVFVIQIARNPKQDNTWIRWSLFGAVVTQCMGIADITQPLLWITLALAVHYGSQKATAS